MCLCIDELKIIINYLLQSLEVCFGSLSCRIINPINYSREGIA